MRPDMKDIFYEPGRYGSSWKKNERVGRLRRTPPKDDDCGHKESIRRECDDTWDSKINNKNQHWATIKRWLRSKIGMKWDDVYSEIREVFSRDLQASRQDIWLGYIEKDIKMIDGYPHLPPSYDDRYHALRKGELYLDENGVLREAQGLKEKPSEVEICVLKVHDKKYLVKNKKGIWFTFEYSDAYHTEKYEESVWHHQTQTSTKIWKERKVKSNPEVTVMVEDTRPSYNGYNYSWGYDDVWMKDRNARCDYRLAPRTPAHYYLVKVSQTNSKEKKKYGI